MKHCYTDCKLISDDEYRTRYDCTICKKSFYQLKDRTVESKDSSKILLIDGTPYITCENPSCGQLERLADALDQSGKSGGGNYRAPKHNGGTRQPLIKKIRIFIPFNKPEKKIHEGYEELEPEYKWVKSPSGELVRIVQPRSRMVFLNVNGCSKCWNFQDMKTKRLGKLHVFQAKNNRPVYEDPVLPSGAKLAPKVEVTVVQSTFPSGNMAGTQKVWNTVPDPKVDIAEGLYGPYNDRKVPK